MNSKRRCGWCKEYFRPDRKFPGPVAWCSELCGTNLAFKKLDKKKADELREQKRKFKQRADNFKAKDHSYQFALTKAAAQKLANRLDAHLPCICCDAPRNGVQFCGGHYKTKGAHPELSVDLRNIHGQRNKTCNKEKSGNIAGDKSSKGFKQGLIDRYGQWIVNYLEKYHSPKKYTCEELIAIRKLYAAETRRIESGLPPSRNWRSLDQAIIVTA